MTTGCFYRLVYYYRKCHTKAMSPRRKRTTTRTTDKVIRQSDLSRELEKFSRRIMRATQISIQTSIEELAQIVKQGFDRIEENFATKEDLQRTKEELRSEFKQDLHETETNLRHEFNAVAENIHQDVAGANKDEISLIKDQVLPDHEVRIHSLEKQAGLTVGPRNK